MNPISTEAIDTLKANTHGEVVLPGDPNYDEVRSIWNAMIDRRPGAILRCAGVEDVVAAVNTAREHGLLVSVRGGGHNIAGNSLCNGGLTIDLSEMKAVRVDAGARIAYVEPGATLADVDAASQAHGLATSLGINSTTGVAGLTLGGGFGWLTRKYGMTVDNLLAADVVTADGRQLRASADQNPELFWALRGGGGNFGIVTGFEFRLHPVGPEVLSGLIVYPYAQARTVLEQYREYAKTLPDEMTVWAVLRKAPPLPFLPEAAHGQTAVVLAFLYTGDVEEGRPLIEPARHFGDSYGEFVGTHSFAAWQQAFDPLLTPGARNYWKSHNLAELSDGALGTVIEYAGSLPSPQCEIFIAQLGGAANRVAVDATAYPHRNTAFVLNVHGRWDDAAQDQTGVGWSREFFQAATPYAQGGVYVNFLTEEETARVGAAYGPGYARLVEVKKRYDPQNFFRLNQNIQPAA